jgi:NTP pyrophosphatase (non-canonical NTP hydrolase)
MCKSRARFAIAASSGLTYNRLASGATAAFEQGLLPRPTFNFLGDFTVPQDQASVFNDLGDVLLLDEYQERTATTERSGLHGLAGFDFVLLGLFGEVGGLLSELKKKLRDKDAYVAYNDSVIEEFGDVLWYFTSAARRANLSLSTLAHRVLEDLTGWDYQGQREVRTFVDLQRTTSTRALADKAFERRLLALAGKVGALVEHYSSGQIAAHRDRLSADLVGIFRALVQAADEADISLNVAARRNLLKIEGRWPSKRIWGALYDENFPSHEQIPRLMVVTFTEVLIQGRSYVVQQLNGKQIGDKLTDNRSGDDDYRFHDVFHLAYATFLGWSPTLRKMIGAKRKSDTVIDENEDGARAMLIEEGIATWLFNHAERHSDFRSTASLDYGVLKVVQEFVKGYEVASRPLWQWEAAILESFRAFRLLKEHRGGCVVADLLSRTLTYGSLP